MIKINNIKTFLASFMLFLALALTPVALSAGFASAAFDPGGSARQGSEGNPATCATGTAPDGSCLTPDSSKDLSDIAAFIINIFSWIVGAVSVIMIIYGGFRYITSGGDSNGVKAGKDTVLYAIVGLVIVALAQIIVNFVLDKTDNIGTTPTQ